MAHLAGTSGSDGEARGERAESPGSDGSLAKLYGSDWSGGDDEAWARVGAFDGEDPGCMRRTCSTCGFSVRSAEAFKRHLLTKRHMDAFSAEPAQAPRTSGKGSADP